MSLLGSLLPSPSMKQGRLNRPLGAFAAAVMFGALIGTALPTVAVAQGCGFNSDVDFNGDGFTDVAISDPDATVAGVGSSGRVHIVYGGNVGTQTISPLEPFIPDEVKTGERFGHVVDTYDADLDGCDDLVVGIPDHTVDGKTSAGAVLVIHGSPGGLGVGQVRLIRQESIEFTSAAGDEFGYSISAGNDDAGNPFLLVGAPGEDIGDAVDAGAAYYIYPADSCEEPAWSMFQGRISGDTAEAGDRYGAAVAADPRHLVVGVPFEDVGDEVDAGMAHVYRHGRSAPSVMVVCSDEPAWIANLDQEGPGQGGIAEAGDLYGWSVDTVRFTDTDDREKSMLAVGSPGEALGVHASAGRVVSTLAIDSEGSVEEFASVHQAVEGVYGAAEPGDQFGWKVALVNRNPGAIAAWDDVLLTVGIPGEEGTQEDAGAIQIFSAITAPGDHDMWLRLNEQPGLTWTPTQNARLGESFEVTATHLMIGDPGGAEPAVYAVPWTNLTHGTTDAVRVFSPGTDGIPVSGVGSFGTSLV